MDETVEMHKEQIVKEDGRYLVFYYFDDEPAPAIQPPTSQPDATQKHGHGG